MRIYFRGKDYGLPGDNALVREISGPFKGTCQHCLRRTNVRLYPYSYEEWLGVLCRECFDYISAEISAGGT